MKKNKCKFCEWEGFILNTPSGVIGKYLNGTYLVMAFHRFYAADFPAVVLVETDGGYVTFRYDIRTNLLSYGNYFNRDILSAVDDFKIRVLDNETVRAITGAI